MERERTRGEYSISTDRARLDLQFVHAFLSTSYWASGRTLARVKEAVAHSLPLGLYRGQEQVGFARVLSDRVVLAFLADVFVIEAHRGRGLGLWLVQTAMSLPELRRVRRWLLGTRDAHALYAKLGFGDPIPGVLMEKLDPASDREDG